MTVLNRAFVYGDLVFETLRVEDGQVLHLNKHYQRLESGLKVLGITHAITPEWMQQVVSAQLSGKNRARVRLTVWRDSTGFYLPDQNDMLYQVDVFDLPQTQPEVQTVGIFRELYRSCTRLSNYKTGNALITVLAARYANQQGWDDALILNEFGNVCEATASNVFIQQGAHYLTPPLSEGCIAGVQREVFIETLRSQSVSVVEKPLTVDDVLLADAVYFTNVIQGVRRVVNILVESAK